MDLIKINNKFDLGLNVVIFIVFKLLRISLWFFEFMVEEKYLVVFKKSY